MNMTKNANGKIKIFAYEMTAPTLLFLLLMTIYPVFFTIYYGFTNYNYLKGTHPFTGLAIALFVKSLKRGQKIVRTLLLLPFLLPAVTVALIWRMMLSPNYGIVTQLFITLGLPVYNWFYDTKTAFSTLLIIDVWQNAPFAFLLIYAHLQGVPEAQYQAASIDGAGALQRFWHITLPNIGNGIALCAMLRTIDTFRMFEKVNILTGGGPANTTTTITQFMYTYGIKTLKFGFASACAIVMTIFVLVMSAVYIKKAMK